MDPDRRRFRTFLVFDLVTAITAVVAMLVVWLTVLQSSWLLLATGAVAVAAGLMILGLRALDRGRIEHAVAWLAVANWGIALVATAIATFAWPLMVLAALLPAVFAMPYASGLTLRAYLFASLAVSVGVAMLGLLQDFSGLSEALPESIRQAVIIVFTPFLGGMIVQLGLENNAYLTGALVEARAVNDRLRRSEEALEARAEELRRSRARVVAATDLERRRIERDLHDGAQQRLVALSVRLSVAHGMLPHDVDGATRELEAIRGEVRDAQLELQRLAQGVYPPVLTQHGLGEALRSALDRCPNRAQASIAEVGRFTPELEAAIYFCCVEAIQNVTKHAGPAAVVRVSLAAPDDDRLRFEVADDGLGFDPASVVAGNGFANIRDRLGAFGGEVTITARPGEGTSVLGVVPTGGSPAPAGPRASVV